MQLVTIALAFGLSAGIFEEVARYLVYLFWIKQTCKWGQAMMFATGHGGIEAVLLGVVTLFTAVQIIALQDIDLSTQVPPEQLELAQAQLDTFWAALVWSLARCGGARGGALHPSRAGFGRLTDRQPP